MLSFLRRGFRRLSRTRPAARHAAPTCRPGLEALDGRTLLSGVTSLQTVAAPNVNGSGLNAVAEIAPNDIWAVGSVGEGTTKVQPLAENFNGTTWSVVPTPTAPNGSSLNGVAGVAAKDVWAVGTSGSASAPPLVEHWNGTSWSIVSTPTLPQGGGVFNSVTAIASNDVWAVGFTGGADLIENWNGTSWNVVSTPPTGRSSVLNGVSGDTSSDVWAVGLVRGAVQALHFNGTTWSTVPTASLSVGGRLNAVTAIAPNNVWAVGFNGGGSGNDDSLIEHFDGISWSIVPSPAVSGVADGLVGVAAVSANNIWAVGRFFDPNANVPLTLTEHWDGTSWSVVPSPSAAGGSLLNGVSANPSNGDVVAVGNTTLSNGQDNGLILANNEPAGSTPVSPTPTPTPTPPPPPPVTDVVVVGTFADAATANGKGPHKTA